jgi:ribosomal protein S18 acetylase RimI-like enzyme
VTIRNAVAADIPAVLELWARARSSNATSRDDAEVVGRLLETDPGALLVAEDDGGLLGTVIAAWDGWRGNIYRLAVAPERRREGIARRLVEAGEKRLRERGAARVSALAWRDDDPAYRLWDAVGFEENPGVARFVRNV